MRLCANHPPDRLLGYADFGPFLLGNPALRSMMYCSRAPGLFLYLHQAYSRSASGSSQLSGHVIRLNVDNFVLSMQLTACMERQWTTSHRCGIFKQVNVGYIQARGIEVRVQEASLSDTITGLLRSWSIMRLNLQYVSVAPSTARYYMASIYPSRPKNTRSSHAQE